MYILAFDTTASACSIILCQNNSVLAKYEQVMEFGQSEVLLPEIQKMLTEQNITFADIHALFVCVGPGSFTGVRSSVSAARTFQIACPNLCLGGVSAFDAYVSCLLPKELTDTNVVIIETKRDDFYVQIFDSNLQKTTLPQALPYNEIISLLKGKKVTLIGDGVERFLSSPSGLSLHCIKIMQHLDISALVKVGIRQYNDKRLDYPKPLYLRAPDVCLPKVSQS